MIWEIGKMTDFSRRSILKMMGAGALAASAPWSRQAFAAREKELNILCWEGYNSAEVLDPYRKLTGAEVKAESATNDPTMVNKLRAGETKVWDLINVNNPWARKMLYPEHLIKPLDRKVFEPFFEKMLPDFKPPYKWAMSDDGKELLGMAQRFGPFSFVVNTDKISKKTAEEQGWKLWADDSLKGKYGSNCKIFDPPTPGGFKGTLSPCSGRTGAPDARNTSTGRAGGARIQPAGLD